MTDVTAAQVRRDALARLVALAGPRHERTDLGLVAARPAARHVLYRAALRAAADEFARHELEVVWPIVNGDAGALDDAVHAGGIGALLAGDPAAAPMTLDQLAGALDRMEVA